MVDASRLAIIVAGMHRSGTSALTRAINLLGVDLPDRLVPGSSGNELGHWEPEAVVAIHDAMLQAAGSDVNDVVGFDPAWIGSDGARESRQRILDYLETTFARASVVAIKDPRICLVLPAWTEALDRLGIAQAYILPYRQPAEVAASLERRQTQVFPDSVWPRERGGLLWLRHVVEAERFTRGRRRSFIAFDRLLADWRTEMARVAGQLGLRWPAGLDARAAEIDAFLDRQHKHETASGSNDSLSELDGYLDDLRRLEAEPDWTGHRFGDEALAAPIRRRYLNTYVMAMERKNLLLSERSRAGTAESLGAPESGATFEYAGLSRVLDVAEADAAGPLDADRLNRALARLLRDGSASVRDRLARAAAAVQAAESREREVVARAAEAARLRDVEERTARDRDERIARERAEGLERALADAREREQAATLAEAQARQDAVADLADLRERHAAEVERRTALELHLKALRVRRPAIAVSKPAGLAGRVRALLGGRDVPKAITDRAERVRGSGLFDADWYLDAYPDVELAGADPLRHFVEFGSAEGRDPGPRFSALSYLAAYADCREARYEPLFHYVDHGLREGRPIFPVETRARGAA